MFTALEEPLPSGKRNLEATFVKKVKLSFETGKCYFLVRPIIGISSAYVAAFSNQGSFIVILKREMEICSIQPLVTTEDASLPALPSPGLPRSGELPGGTGQHAGPPLKALGPQGASGALGLRLLWK